MVKTISDDLVTLSTWHYTYLHIHRLNVWMIWQRLHRPLMVGCIKGISTTSLMIFGLTQGKQISFVLKTIVSINTPSSICHIYRYDGQQSSTYDWVCGHMGFLYKLWLQFCIPKFMPISSSKWHTKLGICFAQFQIITRPWAPYYITYSGRS